MTINSKAQNLFDKHLADYEEQYREECYPRWLETKDIVSAVMREPITPEHMQIMWEDAAANDCESPIEQMLLAALMFCSTGYASWPVPVWNNQMPFPPMKDRVFVSPQFGFGNYRIDIAMFGMNFDGTEFRLAIECDGHNFHKSKDQMKRDRKRDRFCQLMGWHIVRFTGSEIYADPDACAEEVGELVCQIFDDKLEQQGHIVGGYREKRLKDLGYVSPFSLMHEATA